MFFVSKLVIKSFIKLAVLAWFGKIAWLMIDQKMTNQVFQMN